MPFDIQQMRTIGFDHTNLKSADRCSKEIVKHLRAALDGSVDSPVAASVNLRQLEKGSSQERTLAELVSSVDGMGRQVRSQAHMLDMLAERGALADPIHPEAIADLLSAADALREITDARDDDQLKPYVGEITAVATYLERMVPLAPSAHRRRVRRLRSTETARETTARRAVERHGDGPTEPEVALEVDGGSPSESEN